MLAGLDGVLPPEFGGSVKALPDAAIAAAPAAGVGLGRGVAQCDAECLRVLLQRGEQLACLCQLARDARSGQLLEGNVERREAHLSHLSRRFDLDLGVFCSR